MSVKLQESASRSFVKAITYRGIIFISDGIIIYGITHRSDIALMVIILSNVASTLFYFIHERVWNKIRWGKVVKK